MIKRTLYIGNPAYLSLQNAQLLLRQNTQDNTAEKTEVKASIPIEDIGIVVLDNSQITITHGLLDALLQNNVALISCDKTHHPTGLLMPLSGNTIQNERFRAQIQASEPLKKQLWAQTITYKIQNQSKVLQKNNLPFAYIDALHKYIKSGDTDNCEATAAAYYWQHLFPNIPGFKRHREGAPPNHYFNYGYAILRATMARSIVSAGLLPTLGIHHQNRYNAYCLADDLMEPYRPFVDLLVLDVIQQFGEQSELTKEIKAHLLKIPVLDVILNDEKSPLMIATQRTAVSLVKCYNGEQRKLVYPKMV